LGSPQEIAYPELVPKLQLGDVSGKFPSWSLGTRCVESVGYFLRAALVPGSPDVRSLRRPLSLPITLAVVMIVLLVVLTVGWVLLSVFGALANYDLATVYWVLLSIGTTFMVLLIVGVVMYLALSVKAINLNRRQSNFVDSVTHELKSPIASLKLYLQTLNRRQVSAQEQAEFHRLMLEEVERLNRLINHVLDAGRLEADRVGREEDVALAPLLRECAEMACVRYHAPADTVQVDAEPCAVRGQPVELDMIFRNLLDNAVKYAGPQPRVEVRARVVGGAAVIQVSDNGRGIPPQLRRRIFGRFVRLGSELERDKPGTGLGLYIVRTQVRRLRGSIRVCDRPDGSGAMFEVRLPGATACKNESAGPV
jgi:two-component system, OmpR family, phosphate regulon sensor histidine kinase PhoR